MTTAEQIKQILVDFTKAHRISASTVILEQYAEELVKNGVIVPPCKVGDTVYRVDKWNGWIIATSTAKSITPRLDHLNRYVFEILSTHTDVLGETVFLDREEAEEALERKEYEINRERIIRALECCSNIDKDDNCSIDCPFGCISPCERTLMYCALDLIKELSQAHEMLSESYDHLEKTKDELLAERSRLTEENERLRAELEQRPPKLIITKKPKERIIKK